MGLNEKEELDDAVEKAACLGRDDGDVAAAGELRPDIGEKLPVEQGTFGSPSRGRVAWETITRSAMVDGREEDEQASRDEWLVD